MREIDDYERRLSVALHRIGAAAERLAEAPPVAQASASETDSAAEVEIARLTRQLDEAHGQTAELADRLHVLRERQQATVATLETRVSALTAQIDAQGVEVQRLRMVNVQLREALRGLRDALTEGMADPGQINRAMQAELDAMRTARQIEAAELDVLLDALDPLIAGAEVAAAAPPEPESDDARA